MIVPGAQRYRMPAEWSAHARCWMAWPCRRELWGDGLDAACAAYAAVARAIARFEPVTMVVRAADVGAAAARCGTTVDVMEAPLDDSWMRDIGPTFLCNGDGDVAGVAWRFNAWGDKYRGYANDAALAARLLDRLKLPRFDAPFVLEGGAVHSDGEGTVLTTESVLLNPNRGMAGSKAAAEALLRDWLGAETVIWLPAGMAEDETDGHVDNVACFAAPGRVLALAAPDPADPNHAGLAENLNALAAARDARGRRLEVVRLDQSTLPDGDGKPGAASYINFYIANGGIVMPSFATDEDAAAVAVMRAAFPGREVVQVDARAIVRGGGGIHCITQQQPRGGKEAGCET
ncbi:MAG: agmatine deiminase family protein [Gammaproteobacteria bacterium]|jgi:agmatine deiminase